MLALAVSAQRSAATLLNDRYCVASWDSGSGLPQNTINGLVETPDGMIWAATFGGLGRFSGRDWTVFDAETTPGMMDARFVSMTIGPGGEIWLGSQNGSVGRFVGSSFELVADLDGRTVRALLVLADGSALCACEEDVWLVAPGQEPRPRYPQPVAGIAWLRSDRVGRVWAGGVRPWLFTADAPRLLSSQPSADLASGEATEQWLGTSEGLSQVDDRGALASRWSNGHVRAVKVARDGAIWFASHRRVWCMQPGQQPIPVLDAEQAVADLLVARDGSIWVATFGAGVHRLCARELRVLPLPDERPDKQPVCVAPDGKGGWFVGGEHGLYYGDDSALRLMPSTAGLQVAALLPEADGRLWLGCGSQLVELDAAGQRVREWPLPGFVRAVHRVAGSNLLYLGTGEGLFVLDEATAGPPVPVELAHALRGDRVKLIQPDGDGGLWVGAESGLLHLPAGDSAAEGLPAKLLRRGVELPAAEVRAVLRTPAGRDWCVTYGAGLVPLPIGSGPSIGRGEGLPDAFLCSAVAVAGRWLIGGNLGPLVVDPKELDAIAGGDHPWLSCRPLVGVTGTAAEANGGSQPSAAVRGTVAAMCALDGVWIIDLANLPSLPPPPVCLAELVGQARAFLQPDGSVAVPASAERTFVVRLTGPRFDAPGLVRFRWQVQPGGVWSRPSEERTVTFTLPGAGEYTFVAEALGYERRAHPEPVRLRLHLAPRLWERGWFAPLAVAIGLAVAWLTFRFGSRRAALRARWLEAVVASRTAELREVQASLEQRVQLRTAELEHAMASIEGEHQHSLELEAELARSRRIEGLGLLAGGVAHDFNNLLTAVLGNAELLEHKLRGDRELGELARRVREAGLRGRDLTRRLLTVASQQMVRAELLSLQRLLEDLRPALQELLGHRIDLSVSCEPGLPTLRGARSQLEQILVNLCANARQAMPEGGRVTIEVDVDVDRLRLVFEDDGAGMTAEVCERAFEPFFTTRSFDQAPGLGLATVLGITRQLGGEVQLSSAPSEGSRFEFRFPIATDADGPGAAPAGEAPADEAPADEIPADEIPAPAPATPAIGAATAGAPPPGKVPADASRLRVLLIEDELAVRIALRRIIELSGCDVVGEAENGRRAVRLLDDPACTPDVVLSDVRMPGLSGVALIEALRECRKGLPIVFLTGFAWGSDEPHELQSHGVEMLGKPPERDELLAALWRAVEARA